ncbi:hypothetical protein ACP3WQ_25025, partial [Salmonella enterica]|uniref:hypothetical protein n=1 Tax=Salmonella enterica TaxID=28901 RepID=UPI003CF37C5E
PADERTRASSGSQWPPPAGLRAGHAAPGARTAILGGSSGNTTGACRPTARCLNGRGAAPTQSAYAAAN